MEVRCCLFPVQASGTKPAGNSDSGPANCGGPKDCYLSKVEVEAVGDMRTEQVILWDLSVEVGVFHLREVWRVGTWEEEERKLGI